MTGKESEPARRGIVLLVEEEQHVRTLLGKYLADQPDDLRPRDD